MRAILDIIASLRSGVPLRVIDVGAGHGYAAARLAEAGHHLTLVEPASDLLEQATDRVRAVGQLDAAPNVHVQELASDLGGFDLVVCHAVVEWVDDQASLIQRLARLVDQDGWLSILAYNANRALFNRIIRGRFVGHLEPANVQQRESEKLSGAQPVSLEQLTTMIESAGLRVSSASGVRIFHDLIDPALLEDPSRIADLIQVEYELAQVDPFRQLSHHLHIAASYPG